MSELLVPALFAGLMLPTLVSGFGYRQERATLRTAVHRLVAQLSYVAVLAASYALGLFTWDDVGLVAGGSLVVAAGFGGLAYYVLGRVWAQLASAQPAVTTHRPIRTGLKKQIGSYRALVPSSPLAYALTALALAINPFTEEIITRGILVVMLGHALGSAWLGIAVGLLVNVLVHIYQGRANLTYHVLFYAATVALLYSPVGLAGAIACHLAADLGALVFARRTLEQWRALASEERRLAIEAAG